MNEWLLNNLVCPRDKQRLKFSENKLTCPANHVYPVVEDIPILLVEESEHIHGYITETLESVAKGQTDAAEKSEIETNKNAVDQFVQTEIPYTCGQLYFPLLNNLIRYPIPDFRLPRGDGERLLDVGCNWGRWSIAAAQKNYKPVGIDPSLRAILAARRICRQLKVEADFVVGDARHLPFADGCFDVGFSFGVFQHFSKENAKVSLEEIARCVKKNGKILAQMPNKYGVRSFYNQAKRGFTDDNEFSGIRYWTPAELLKFFRETFGQTEMTVDCYFGLGIQKNDADLLPAKYRIIVRTSEMLRSVSKKIPLMKKVADSVYLESINENK